MHSVDYGTAGPDSEPSDSAAAPRARGRPRSELVEKAIIDAALELLGEGATISGLSVEAVAVRAGVGKATIYRRWPNKEALVVDALAVVKEPPPELPGRSVRADLVLFVDRIRRRSLTREGRIMGCVIGELRRHPGIYRRYREEIIEPRREIVRQALRRGIASGELRGDLDIELAVDVLIAPMLFLTLTQQPGKALPEDLPARMVDAVLDGLRPR